MEIRSTDQSDFIRVYNECYALLMKICYHIVYNIDIAQDLVQEAFERFYMKNMSFPSDEDAKYWLIRVSKNLALNHVRKNKREINMVEKVKQMPTSSSYVVDGVKELADKETIKEVRAAIEMLPDNLKMVKLVSVYNMYADRKLFLPYLVKEFILQIAACISHFAPPVSKNAPLSPCPVPPCSRIPLHRTNVCVPPCGTM